MTDDAIERFYQQDYDEAARLARGAGLLELLRTQQIIAPHLTGNGLQIADVGGGPGVYSMWLASLGHHVRLIDPVPRHIEQALGQQHSRGSVDPVVGDARRLDLDDDSLDVVLMLGPLYHLQEPGDRAAALTEAMRVLKPGGRLFAAAVSRFASTHDGMARRLLLDPKFVDVSKVDIETGRHENPDRHPDWFTTAYFHHPTELRDEVADADFEHVAVVGIEGLAGWFDDLDQRLNDPQERAAILAALERVQEEPSLLGVSAHLLASGVKPG